LPMTYGIDISEEEIRWVRLPKGENPAACGRILLEDNDRSPRRIRQVLKEFFSRERVSRFVFPLCGQGVRARVFASDKVDISELEDNVAWEAKFMLEYNRHRDVLSFDPLRSVGSQTWIVAVAAPLEVIQRKSGLFPKNPTHIETALTALANAVLHSKWGEKDIIILHLDRSRGFLVVVSHGNPILMQEIPRVNLKEARLSEEVLSFWYDELKVRRNFLPQDKRRLDHFLLSGEAALVPENARALGECIDLTGEVFDPFDGVQIECKAGEGVLFPLAYACALRRE